MSDEFVQRFLDAPDTREALGWLKEDQTGMQRTLGEGLPAKESIQFVQAFYDAGAQQVLAVKIDDYGHGMENTGKIVIQLPDAPDQRAALLAKAGEIAQSQGFDAEPDNGQRYVFLMLD